MAGKKGNAVKICGLCRADRLYRPIEWRIASDPGRGIMCFEGVFLAVFLTIGAGCPG